MRAHPKEIVGSAEAGRVVNELADAPAGDVHAACTSITRRKFPAVATIFRVVAVVALKATRTICERIADAIFAVDFVDTGPDCFLKDLRPLREIFLKGGEAAVQHGLFDLLEFFLGDRLVPDVVRRIAQIGAEEAVRAPVAVDAEGAVSRIVAAEEVA